MDWIKAAGGLATAFDVTTKGILHAVFEVRADRSHMPWHRAISPRSSAVSARNRLLVFSRCTASSTHVCDGGRRVM